MMLAADAASDPMTMACEGVRAACQATASSRPATRTAGESTSVMIFARRQETVLSGAGTVSLLGVGTVSCSPVGISGRFDGDCGEAAVADSCDDWRGGEGVGDARQVRGG